MEKENMKYFNKQILEAINKGIKLALDDYQDIEDNSSVSSDIINTDDIIKNKIEFNKVFVDMGFPSGTLWCKYNLGCDFDLLNKSPKYSKPEDWYGDYYCWGEIETKPEYRPIDYKFIADTTSTYTKYNGGLNDKYILDLCDDAAYVNNPYTNLHINICLPSAQQIVELLGETTRRIVYNYKDVVGLNVVILTSIHNGAELVFPLGGFKQYKEVYNDGERGYIMSNYMYKEYNYRGYVIKFEIKYTPNKHIDIGFEGTPKSIGVNVKPVLMKPTLMK